MNSDNDSLVTDLHKSVGKITGDFYVPDYQRGYRWTKDDVERLLDDIEQSRTKNPDKTYTLQPIVVRRREQTQAQIDSQTEQWELIDGQQRLTTLYLIQLVIRDKGWRRNAARYSLHYDTRKSWTDFKAEVLPKAESNIDYFHLSQAYRTIENWFAKYGSDSYQEEKANGLLQYLLIFVKVIWYEPMSNLGFTKESADHEAISLFTRLNVGRIPLTDAELVKASLLTKIRSVKPERVDEISAQWDGIERDLQKKEVWSFVSALNQNETITSYPTRISFLLDARADQLLDLADKRPASGNDAKAPPEKRKRYQTFELLRQSVEEDPIAFWASVIKLHAHIIGWLEMPSWHNKIGFLIATGHKRFDEIINKADIQKHKFEDWLNTEIADSLKLSSEKINELSYESAPDRKNLLNVLLLFNIEALTRTNRLFPFFEHTGDLWSLEHIHAQHSEGMNKEIQWKIWLDEQVKALQILPDHVIPEDDRLKRTNLISKVKATLSRDKNLDSDTFSELHREIVPFFGNGEPDHSIRNLALLSSRHNSKLNNAVFEAKRQIILKFDRHGQYVPICTRHVFLKYYAKAGEEQLHFWSDADKTAYIKAITCKTLGIGKYLQDVSKLAEKL